MLRSRCSLIGLALLAISLAACSAGPEINVAPAADVREARLLLVETAAEGAVQVDWRGQPPLSPSSLLRAVEQGVRGMEITASASGDAARRFVFDFSGELAPLCGDAVATDEAGLEPELIRAAFCDGERVVASAVVAFEGDPARLIWRLTDQLVPDDYEESYGLDLLGNRVGVGGGVSF